MSNWLLLPPIAFVLILAVCAGLSLLASRVAPHPATSPAGKGRSYGCGEDVKENRAQPEYSQFFPFAFFFTIMHVVALIVATAPAGSLRGCGMAVLYVLASVVGLFILYRR